MKDLVISESSIFYLLSTIAVNVLTTLSINCFDAYFPTDLISMLTHSMQCPLKLINDLPFMFSIPVKRMFIIF